MNAVTPVPSRRQDRKSSNVPYIEFEMDDVRPTEAGGDVIEVTDLSPKFSVTSEADDLERGACGALIDPGVSRTLRAEMSGFDDDDMGDEDDDAVIEDGEDDLEEFDEIDEDDFDDEFDDDFEEELEDEYEIEIEDEISAEFGLGPDRDDEVEELDDLESLADDLDDLEDSDDLKD